MFTSIVIILNIKNLINKYNDLGKVVAAVFVL